MASEPLWITDINVWAKLLTTANPATDGSGALVTLVPAVSKKHVIKSWGAIAQGPTHSTGGIVYVVRVTQEGVRLIEDFVLIDKARTPGPETEPWSCVRIRDDADPILLLPGDNLSTFQTTLNLLSVKACGGPPE